MTLHVNEFDAGGLVAAYTTDTAPEGRVVGKDSNAVLIATQDGMAVVSMPRADGAIGEWFPEAAEAPLIPLKWAFGS